MTRSGTAQKQNKSEVIRTLAAKGLSRSEIAKKMGVRYQFVRNVLVQQEEKSKRTEKAPEPVGRATKVTLGPDGRIVIPAPLREALGFKENETLFLSVEEGELRIRTLEVMMRRVQALVRRYIPEGVSLVDELLEDRRREVEEERRG